MNNRMQRYFAIGKLTGLAVIGIVAAYAIVYALARVFGAAIAYADTGAPGPADLSATDIAAWAALILSLAVTTLKLVAPRTKATWDDELLARLEALEGVVHRPAPVTVSGEVDGGKP